MKHGQNILEAMSQSQARPSHPDLIEIHRGSGSFSSYSTSLVDLNAGSLFTRITSATLVSAAAYSTVQTGKDSHVELNSDLLYTNHSCDPSLIFDMKQMEVRVVDDRPLKKGDVLTFFYPSTEWEMAQAFDCQCRTPKCLGTIQGAKHMQRDILRTFWLNKHIEDLLKQSA
jgi:hypothetical protein